MRARHRLGKSLLRHGERYPGPGSAWTLKHMRWLQAVRLPESCAQATHADYLAASELLTARRRTLLSALEQEIPECSHAR